MLDALARELAGRRPVVEATPVLTRLAARLTRLLEPLRDGPPYLPEQKALLSRDGGVCPHDGTRLAFDPLSPHDHACPRCGARVQGERHHRAWSMRYHLWLSERALHAALLPSLGGDPATADIARRILAAYAGRYRTYPDRDNVLGPSRLFFSTYLESIWCTQVALAGALLDAAGHGPDDAVRAVALEAAERIATFDEGFSNRQVWNAAALAAVGGWLAAPGLLASGRAAIERLLDVGVGADGMWHEGENYHLFALRGLALAAQVLHWSGAPAARAHPALPAMFAAPLATLLPDLTLPARGDAPYGVSIRQPRFAELWEWGRTFGADRRLDPVLAALYDPVVPAGDDHGLAEIAEQEQNRAPARVHRDRLGWKALLWMPPEPPAGGAPGWPTAALLPDQGVCVLRPVPGRYVSVECGRRRGGHGHPDLLHLSLMWDRPLLADFGTASYVSDSLHWYRASEAHNVPFPPGGDQPGGAGWCEAVHAADGWAWCRVVAPGLLGPGTLVRRTVIAGPAWIVDCVDVDVPHDQEVLLAVHPLPGARDAVRLVPRAGEHLEEREAPGPPTPDFADGAPLAYRVRRAAGPGRWMQVYDPDGVVRDADRTPAVVTAEGRFTLGVADDALDVRRDGEVVVTLRGPCPAPAAPPVADLPAPPRVRVERLAEAPSLTRWPAAPVIELGRAHYRRSEVPYEALGDRFAARVAVAVHGSRVVFWVAVRKGDFVVRRGDAPDPALDNESPDIHSDGVQCYVGRDAWEGYLVLPADDPGGGRVRAVAGTAGRADRVEVHTVPGAAGYAMLIACDTGRPFAAGDRFRFTVTVNEMRPGRERRAGQLALAGGGWVYLRGDRESPALAWVGEVG